MSKLIVIADDFTGANDTAVQFAKKGAHVMVALSTNPVACDIPIINTESRALKAQEAAQAVTTAIQNNITDNTHIVFKKIDSTFRGNIGAEIEAASIAFNVQLIIIAAAIPAAGRTTIEGECRVHGIAVTDTEFATDPKTAVQHSSIAKIMASQSQLPCHNMTLREIRNGQFLNAINKACTSPATQVLIADAETDEDLAKIAEHLVNIKEKIILVGAAGIANQLPKSLFMHNNNPLPLLVLAGSMSEVTQQQIEYCRQYGLNIIDIDVQDIWQHYNSTLSNVIKQAVPLIKTGKHCAIRTSSCSSERERSREFCYQQNIDPIAFSNLAASFLGKLGQLLIKNSSLSAVLLTGGDTAMAVASEIDTDGYIIKGEILPCIPYGYFTNHDTMIITKAGGFGTIDAIEKIMIYLQESL